MGLFRSDQNLAAQLKDALARAETAEADLAVVNQRLADAQALVAQQQAELQAASVRAEQGDAELKEVRQAVQAAQAEAADLKAKLANPGKAYEEANVGREKPVAEGGAAGDGEGPATWAAAVAACGGDYIQARRKFPGLHLALLQTAREKQTA